jgi:hypothetical protein
LLIPEWSRLSGAPLNQIVAQQWASTTRILLDDLEAMPRERWRALRYEAFTAAPQAEVAKICGAVGLTWDRAIGPNLPLARNTVSQPEQHKWRLRAQEIEAVAALFAEEDRRAQAFLQE